jgi:hypothetical protein
MLSLPLACCSPAEFITWEHLPNAVTPTSLLFSSRSLTLPLSCLMLGPQTFSSHIVEQKGITFPAPLPSLPWPTPHSSSGWTRSGQNTALPTAAPSTFWTHHPPLWLRLPQHLPLLLLSSHPGRLARSTWHRTLAQHTTLATAPSTPPCQ